MPPADDWMSCTPDVDNRSGSRSLAGRSRQQRPGSSPRRGPRWSPSLRGCSAPGDPSSTGARRTSVRDCSRSMPSTPRWRTVPSTPVTARTTNSSASAPNRTRWSEPRDSCRTVFSSPRFEFQSDDSHYAASLRFGDSSAPTARPMVRTVSRVSNSGVPNVSVRFPAFTERSVGASRRYRSLSRTSENAPLSFLPR